MSFSLSPAVTVREKDLTVSVAAVPTDIVGMVGYLAWGPCIQKVQVTQQKDLEELFHTPDAANYEHWFSAYNFLQYGSNLHLVRAIKDANAMNGGIRILDDNAGDKTPTAFSAKIVNDQAAEDYVPSFPGGNDKWNVVAKYPGPRGDDFSIAIANTTDFLTANVMTGVTFISQFEYAPGAEEVAIVIFDGTDIVERWIVSLTEGSKDYEGNSNYVEDIINRGSSYILIYDDVVNTIHPASNEITALAGGVADAPEDGDVTNGYDLFANPEQVDVNVLCDGANNSAVIHQYIIDSLVDVRLDCVGYLCVPKAEVVGVASQATAIANCVDYRTNDLARTTSYANIVANWKYMYDKYNDKYRWVPISADIAGLRVMTNWSRDAWFAEAGYNRGLLKGVVKLAINPDKTQRGTLYKAGLNPVLMSDSEGAVLLGQKTMLVAPSAFDRLDVRWLFIVLEKSIATSSKYFMFEKNTPFTRRRFVGMVEPFLRDVEGREGIEDFHVQCDEALNTDVVRQRNEFRANIYIKPTYSAEFIILEFINVNGNVSFNEVVAKA